MQQNNNDIQNIAEDEISLKELILKIKDWYRFLLSKWIVLVAAGIIGGAIGVGYAFMQKPTYTASLSFALEDEKSGSGGLSGAMGLASSLGIDLGGSAGGAFSGSNLLELMKSRTIVEKSLLNPITVNDKTISLIQYFLDFNEINKDWDANPVLKNIVFDVYADRTKYTIQQDSILGNLAALIAGSNLLKVTQKDKKTSIFTIEVNSTNELFCKVFAESIAQEVSSYYIEIKSKKARQNMEILQSQTDSIRAVLNGSIVSVATAVDNTFGLNPAMQVQKTTISKKQFDVQANTAILTQLVTNLEMAKVSLRKETPLIQVIDKPIFPIKKERGISKLKSLILGGFLAGFLTALILVFKKLFAGILAD